MKISKSVYNNYLVAYIKVYQNAVLYLLATLFSGVYISCDSFVEVELPNSQLTSTSVYEEKATANAAMTHVYAKMRDDGIFTGLSNGVSNLLGNYSDELTYYGSFSEGPGNFYNNIVMPSNANIKSLWNKSYEQIYGANSVLEGCSASTALSVETRNQLKGEALFVRALLHFYLANLFGNIPYVKSTNYQVNAKIAKETPDAIYKYCIEDLNKAVELLPSSYLTSDRIRPNKFAAKSILSRVYLYNSQWNEAANEASAVINNTSLFQLENELSKVFLKASPETIWQFAPNTGSGNTLEAQNFIFTSGPPTGSAVSNSLLSAFTAEDQRKVKWINTVQTGNSTWYSVAKYKNKGTGTSTEYSIIIRLSEIFLIRAEARVQAGDIIGSKEDLNLIRKRAGLQNTVSTSQNEILQEILQERKLEFFSELGQRFFDLKRCNKLDEVLASLKPEWNSYKTVLPLPESELLLNENLNPQNNGY
ncbi:RagB/SusD family nutrient uptake outer membrane protein [Flavobacterium sp. C3NV]|uniref:RagB/SusD family nutrient uptake outer membrane protein n=1 Tax=Flavobacterium sp. C3NV TaxID=3393358 RepID=UPI003990003F